MSKEATAVFKGLGHMRLEDIPDIIYVRIGTSPLKAPFSNMMTH